MTHGNCVIWALRQKLRHGGQLHFQWSPDFVCMPRASWSPDGARWFRFVGAVPRWHNALWFRGAPRRVLKGTK